MTLRVLPAGAIAAGVHHTFDDNTLADVTTSMDQLEEAAAAEFHFNMSYDTAGARVTNVNLTMRVTIDMPVWTRVAQRPQAEQNEWNRFLRALRVHEDGHITIFRHEAPTTYERLVAATPSTINDVLEAERQRIVQLNEVYDNRTDHGRTQQTPHGTTVIVIPP